MGTAMAIGTAIGMVMQVAGGLMSFTQTIEQGKSTQEYYNFIAAQYEKQNKFVAEQASHDIGDVRTEARLTQEGQRAVVAGSGFAQSVTTDDILKNTAKLAALDELAIKHNADIKMWENRTQAVLARKAGKNAMKAAMMGGFATLLGTASSVGSQWSQWSQTGGGRSAGATVSAAG